MRNDAKNMTGIVVKNDVQIDVQIDEQIDAKNDLNTFSSLTSKG